MRASRTHAPQPLPPPPLSLPPTPSTVPRRRHRATASSSSSSSSSSVSTASFSPSPSPAPSPRAATATTTTSSVVPFSWERHPGIPKSSLAVLISSSSSGGGSAPLPLPPPLRRPAPPRRRRQRRRRRADVPASADPDAADPFAAAFVECTREEGTDDADADADVADKLWPAPTSSTFSGRPGRPWWLAGGGVVGFLELYGCKSAMDVADGAFLAHRPVAAARPGPGRATRR